MPRSKADSDLAAAIRAASEGRVDAAKVQAAAQLAQSPAVWIPGSVLGLMGLGMLPPALWDSLGYGLYRATSSVAHGISKGVASAAGGFFDGVAEDAEGFHQRIRPATQTLGPDAPAIIQASPLALAAWMRRRLR